MVGDEYLKRDSHLNPSEISHPKVRTVATPGHWHYLPTHPATVCSHASPDAPTEKEIPSQLRELRSMCD
jgi:hypothetical protein